MYFDNKPDSIKGQALKIIEFAKNGGITDDKTIASLLAVISKETGFMPRGEDSYSTTPNERIRKVFGNRVPADENVLNQLKKDDKKFFEQVYGMQYNDIHGLGQTKVGDGYKYRGRGYNGITGRYLYTYFANKTGLDLVNNPDLLNNPEVAGKVAVEYFKYVLGTPRGKYVLKHYYNNPTGNLNQFKNGNDAVTALLHANAGIGFSRNAVEKDVTGGVARARKNYPDMLSFVNQNSSLLPSSEKKNNNFLYVSLGIGIILLGSLLFSVKNKN